MSSSDEEAGGPLRQSPSSLSTPLLLATHHARYSLLLRAFAVWKRRAQELRERRQRIATACRVGAVFHQRIFFRKWCTFIDDRRLQRVEETSVLEGEETAHETSESNADSSDYDKLHDLAILFRKKRCFKQWRRSHDTKTDVSHHILRIRSLHGIRRWHRFVRGRKDKRDLQQRAYFFLYYWLLKRSLNRLAQHAQIRRRERTLTVKIASFSRLHTLAKTMQYWRLRCRLHHALTLWSNYVRHRQHQERLYAPLAEMVKRKTHHRLILLAFTSWAKLHDRNKAHYTLARVIDRRVYQKLCESAWREWKTTVQKLVQLDTFQHNRQERRLRSVWDGWSTWTQQKAYQEQQRRHAVRFHYLSLLKKGFTGFQAAQTQRQLALRRVETMMDAADARLVGSVFSHWDHFTSCRKMKALKLDQALRHSDATLVRRIWFKGFRFFFDKTLLKKQKRHTADEWRYDRTLRRTFGNWKHTWHTQRDHEQTLDAMLKEFRKAKERGFKNRVFANWSEFARARTAKRIVNVQVRGRAHRRILQKCLSQWVTHVAQLRWKLILHARAEQHYRHSIVTRCFERWHHNVELRRSYRDKTRGALVHWKITLQRKVFDGWKQYLLHKRAKQQRIHEALEFRHEQFVRDGLRHWMTAAVHLQGQREQAAAHKQADYAAHIWRRVAAIARHWRYLAIRRRATGETITPMKKVRDTPRQTMDDLGWLPQRPSQSQTRPGIQTRKREIVLPSAAENTSWTDKRSPLSGFVMLPRTRPQPRRPVEVLLLSKAETENVSESNANLNTRESLQCGFQFSVQPCGHHHPTPQQVDAVPHKLRSNSHMTKHCDQTTHEYPSQPTTTSKHLDILEQQLLAMSHRKREWRNFQFQLNTLRGEVDANPRLLPKLRAMEQQHLGLSKQWLQTKERIRSLALEIQLLRNALQA